jgi:tetratricopeptide (TPR) repeat protein
MSARRHKGLTIVLAAALFAVFAAGVLAQSGDESLEAAKAAFKSKRYADAAKLFKAVTDEYPDWSFGHFYLGLSYKNNKQYDQAAVAMKRALDLANNENELFGASAELADIYYRNQDYRNALKYVTEAKKYKGAQKYNKNLANMRTIEGISRYHLGQYQACIDVFNDEIKDGSASANTLRTVAKCYQELKKDAQAVNIIKIAVQKDPKDLAAHLILVKSLLNSEDWREALAAADFALQNFGTNWELNYLKGRALQKLNRLDQAAAALRVSLEIQHQDKVSKLLGDIYRDMGDYLKATDAYNISQRTYANDPTFFISFAFAWYMYVPKDAEKYHGTADEAKYKQALSNATVLLEAAQKLQGADRSQIGGIQDGIKNKMERLDKGATLTEDYEIFIDPETGKVEKRKIEKKDQ